MIASLKAGVLLAANLCECIFYNKRATDISNSTLPLARTIHIEAIRIFTANGDKDTKPMEYLWACTRVHAYHGAFFLFTRLVHGAQG